jgi:phospholipase/carboxylesterase
VSPPGEANPNLQLAPVLAGAPLERAAAVGILVHGRDQDEQVMLDVVDRLALADVAYVLPLAAGRSWYPGRYFDPLELNEPYVTWTLDALDAAIEIAREAGVPAERTVLAGFSQGACLIAELAERRPRPWAGVAVLTGTLMGPDGAQRTPPGLADLPVFVCSSRFDEWVEPGRVRATAQAFQAAGAAVMLESYEDREHLINDRAVAGLRRLLSGYRSPPSPTGST